MSIDKKKILNFVLNRFNVMKKAKTGIDERAYKNYKMYHLIIDEEDKKKKEEWQANLIDPYCFILSEGILAHIYDAFFNSDKFVDIEGQTEKAINKELNVENVLNYLLIKAGIREKAIDIIRAAIKYPAAIVKLKYNYSVGKRFKLENNSKKIEKYIKYDLPDFELIPIWDFYVDPQATEMENARDVIHRSIKDYNELLTEAKRVNEILGEEVYDIKEIEELKNSGFVFENENNPLYQNFKATESDEYYKNIELLEYWGKYDINEDGNLEDVLIVVANRERVIKVIESPYWTVEKPFVKFEIIRKENEFWGHSISELIESNWEEIVSWRNIRMDIAKLLVKPPMLAPMSLEYLEKDLKLKPGKILFYPGETASISFLQLPAQQLLSQIEIQDLKQDMQQTAGPTDPILGSNVGRGVNQTARGISIMASSSLARINIMVQTLAESFKKLVSYYVELIRQYQTEAIIIRKEKEFIKLEPEDLFEDFEYTINFRNVKENIELEKQEIINLISILGKIPGTNIEMLVRILLEYFPRLKGKIEQVLGIEEKKALENMQDKANMEQAVANELPIGTMTGASMQIPPEITPSLKERVETLLKGTPSIKRPLGDVKLQNLNLLE